MSNSSPSHPSSSTSMIIVLPALASTTATANLSISLSEQYFFRSLLSKISGFDGYTATIPTYGGSASGQISKDNIDASSTLASSTTNVARVVSRYWRNTSSTFAGLPFPQLLTSSLSLISLWARLTTIRGLRSTNISSPSSSGRVRQVGVLIGTVLAASHLMFIPALNRFTHEIGHAYDLDELKRVQEEAAEEGRTPEEMIDERVLVLQGKWLRLHLWRVGVDLGCWMCFVGVTL